MDVMLVLPLVKQSLGIMTDVRDGYLSPLINGVIEELADEKGINLEPHNFNHLMFVVDFAAWRYRDRASDGPRTMPRHLQFRLHNLMIHSGSGGGSGGME